MASEQAQAQSVESIKQAISGDVLSSAEEAGVDVESVVNEHLTRHGDYSAKTIARFVATDLQDQVEAEKADQMSGIIMGSRDRYGENWPRRWSLVKSDGEHLQFSTWDGQLDGPSGGELDIPTGGAAVELRLAYDDQYESWEGKRIESIHQFEHGDLVEKLGQVAVSPTFLSRGHEGEIVVIKGSIAFINPQTVFAGDDQDDWYDGEVLQESERGELLPHFELSFDAGGSEYRVRGHFMRQRYCRPYIQVPDLEKLCHDAVRHRDDPESQARFVQDGLRGEEVIAVGRVNNFTANRDDDSGEVVNYVDIGLSALVSTSGAVQVDLEEAAQVDEPAEEPEPEPETPVTNQQVDESGIVAEVRADIEKYCDLTGTDMGTLTVEDINENIGGVEAPDVAIRQALGGTDEGGPADETESAGDDEEPAIDPTDHTVPELKDALEGVDNGDELARILEAERDGGDRKTAVEAITSRREELGHDAESGDDDGFDPDPDADDPFEAVHEDGVYHCPTGDLFQAGSTGELVAHIVDDHDNYGDPGEWIQEQVES